MGFFIAAPFTLFLNLADYIPELSFSKQRFSVTLNLFYSSHMTNFVKIFSTGGKILSLFPSNSVNIPCKDRFLLQGMGFRIVLVLSTKELKFAR